MPNIKLKPLLPLYAVIFFGFAGYSLMITIFTPMLLGTKTTMIPLSATMSYRTILLGILLSLYPLGQFLGSPVLGALSDHYGRRKILLYSLTLTTIFYIFIAMSLEIQNLFLLMISSFLAGLTEGNIVIAQSGIADITHDEAVSERSRLFGYIYLSASAAYIVGPLVGGQLADPKWVAWFNDATPFWLVFLLLALTTAGVFLGFKETKATLATGKINYIAALTNLSHIFTAKRLRIIYFFNFLFYLAIFGFFRCYPMYLVDEFHMQVNQVSIFIAWVAVPIVIANVWLTGLLAGHFTPRILTILSAALTGIFMIVVIIPNSVTSLWSTLFLAALALAICLPSCATLLSILAPQDMQGKVLGNNQSLQVCAESLSGIIGGLLAAVIVKLPLIILGLVAIMGAIGLYCLHITENPNADNQK